MRSSCSYFLFIECQSEEDESCRKAVFKFCVEVSNKEQVNTQVVKEVLGKLLHEVPLCVLVYMYVMIHRKPR